mmetsp:Transcript_103930/g.318367  ORF Transcript_103930/g.318367 Transcript_103930/m.318367 type:complete len:243 (-) Transcript_103930:617-1345(-)
MPRQGASPRQCPNANYTRTLGTSALRLTDSSTLEASWAFPEGCRNARAEPTQEKETVLYTFPQARSTYEGRPAFSTPAEATMEAGFGGSSTWEMAPRASASEVGTKGDGSVAGGMYARCSETAGRPLSTCGKPPGPTSRKSSLSDWRSTGMRLASGCRAGGARPKRKCAALKTRKCTKAKARTSNCITTFWIVVVSLLHVCAWSATSLLWSAPTRHRSERTKLCHHVKKTTHLMHTNFANGL